HAAAADGVPGRAGGVISCSPLPPGGEGRRTNTGGFTMLVQVTLVDINPRMVQAWRATFEENPEVEIVQGSMLEQTVDAWVSPTNSRGSMDGGLDAIIKNHLGAKIESQVQKEIGRQHG